MNPQKPQRKRGRILTEQGLKKLEDAIWKRFRDEWNFKDLSDITGSPDSNPLKRPLDPETVSNILRREEGVDKRSIKRLFSPFGLELNESDLTYPAQKPVAQEAIAEPPPENELDKLVKKVRSHSAAVPQRQEQAQQETPSKNTDFVGREEAIASSIPQNDLDELEKAVCSNYPLETTLIWNFNNPVLNSSNWSKLVSHITEGPWRKVFLLAVGMVNSADGLLRKMKREIDNLVLDPSLQKFLICIAKKSREFQVSHQTTYKPAAIRAYYFTLYPEIATDLSLAIFLELECASYPASGAHLFPEFRRDPSLTLDSCLVSTLSHFDNILNGCAAPISLAMEFDAALQQLCNADLNLEQVQRDKLLIELRKLMDQLPSEFQNVLQKRKLRLQQAQQKPQSVQQFETQIPKVNEDRAKFLVWWKEKGQNWPKELRTVMTKYRDIGYALLFEEKQKKKLRDYYDANRLLVECLNSGCKVSKDTRSYIERNLLLPLAEIEKWRLGD